MLADGIIFFSDLWSPKKRKKKEESPEQLSRAARSTAHLTETHNAEARFLPLNAPFNYDWALTWPGREFDQKGTTPSVEQGHCTLIAVKRYRDPPRIGGRHNFLLLLCSNH